METIYNSPDGTLTRGTANPGNILQHFFILGEHTYSMSYSPHTGEWEFDNNVPAGIYNMQPQISDAIAQYDF